VSKALAILSSDEAHDLFTKTFNPALIQKEAVANKLLQGQASALLRTAAVQLHSPRLAALAARVRLDAFTKVKKAINDMIAHLLKEKEDEIKHKDFCIDEFNANQLQTEHKEREKLDAESKIEDLKMTIEGLSKEIASLKAEIEVLQLELKKAGVDRAEENKEFQETVADQRATQKLLGQALTVLKGFYGLLQRRGQGIETKMVQQEQEQGPPPPPGFKTYSKSKASGGVMGMIEQIINDAKAMEAQAIHDEETAQKAYESFVKETNLVIAKTHKELTNKSLEKAQAEQDLADTEQVLQNVELELEQLSDYNQRLHGSCDFIIKNFDLRQEAREEEIGALKQALAILSGAKFKEFLQG